MHIAILTFDGFDELDTLVAYGLLNRVKRRDWLVTLASPATSVTSMNGLVLQAQSTVAQACLASAVLVGGGHRMVEVLENATLMGELQLDPSRQLVGGQGSGMQLLARRGLLAGLPTSTESPAFQASGPVATASGGLASAYLGAWVIAKLLGPAAAQDALHAVAPAGEQERYVARVMTHLAPHLASAA